MAVPWLGLLDAALSLTDLARVHWGRGAASPAPSADLQGQFQVGGATGNLEARLAGVVVAALKEAFDRDTRRLDFEREQLTAERRRAERAMQLELLRQAAERDIARLRLLAGVDLVAWLGSLL